MLIEFQRVRFGYDRSHEIISPTSFSIEQGQICAILGLNGSGKSTLLKLLAGLCYPVEGRCLIDGVESRDRSLRYLKHLFLVPEEFSLPSLSIERYADVYTPFYDGFDRALFYRLIEEFGMTRKEVIPRMSYGMRKKMLLAFGFATRVPLLLLDEPTHGLDIPSKKQLRKMLASLCSAEQAVVMATQQVRDLGPLLDRLMILHKKELLLNASSEEISRRLLFSESREAPSGSDVLYSETAFPGYKVLSLNTAEVPSAVDAELLFNGAIQNPSQIRTLFSNSN